MKRVIIIQNKSNYVQIDGIEIVVAVRIKNTQG
jgi:hypothetical protein